MLKKINLFIPLSWTVLITILSITNTGTLGNTIKIPHKDKIVHFVFYFLFYVLWYAYFNKKKDAKPITILFLAVGYGILMEVVQSYIKTNRSADLYDVVANSIGALSGLVISHFYLSNKKPI